MAKKKMLQQLDLFGAMFTEEPKAVEQETVNADEASVSEPENVIVTPVSVVQDNRQVVFADDKIGVKIKLKTIAQPIVATENAVQEPAPVVVTEQPLQSQEIETVIPEEPLVIIETVEEHRTKVTKASSKPAAKATKTKSKRGRKSFKEMDAEVDLINIPDEEELKKKLYYPIREVAAFFNVNTSLIRAWEVEFDILQPRKNRKGDRLFRVEDIKNLQIIYYLLRNKKYSVDGAKKYLKENKKKADVQQQLLQSLTKFRSFLVELKANLQA